jgi:peptidoglycan/LPS O-acetylase OafA/YrhL
MSLASRLVLLLLAAGAGLAVYEWNIVTHHPREMTDAALQQFANNDAAAEELRVTDVSRHWWALGGLGGLLLLALLLFWEDIKGWWKKNEPQMPQREQG